jgi:tetratricopeptide (TPR) repeat protein
MGVALFWIVLHFSRKEESAFQIDSDESLLNHSDELELSDTPQEMVNYDTIKSTSQDIPDNIVSMRKIDLQTKAMKLMQYIQPVMSKLKSITMTFYSKLKKSILKGIRAFNDAIANYTSSSNELTSEEQDTFLDQDVSKYTASSKDADTSLQMQSKPEQPDYPKNTPDTIKDYLPKKVPDVEMKLFLVDTEDDIAERNSNEIAKSPERPSSTQALDVLPPHEPQKKAENFIQGLMGEDHLNQFARGTEDAISDNYYYTYMEKRYIKKIVSNPKDVEVYRKLGDLYIEMKNTQDAKASFEQVLRLKPGDKHAILALKELDSIV